MVTFVTVISVQHFVKQGGIQMTANNPFLFLEKARKTVQRHKNDHF